ncbi:competence/damage-inducible protein A [Aquihabitans sp. G128]|uniref:competence/damage-inducible protein A n=1 Tax=Aquihabitans sp. G128 TaxID=2849779 RepID=UPI001C22837A|nr:competence/damage-inducible protein A [Aquihabitans sp. G128]QXC62513.1 competence/damage-inducible protein A [Aquihabitans sp. G128]
MRCEVVAIGTELLLGQIVDTNSSWIGEQLALVGIDSHFQTKVGDNQPRMVQALRAALERSDAVIVCGGLGPTQDDITKEAIAEVMGVDLELDDDIAAHIEAMFTSRGRRMSMNNLRQAEVPVGATAIRDPQPGTAPGIIAPVGDKVIYATPGVPSEMKVIMAGAILPDLVRRAGITATIVSRTLRTWGESESGLAERLAGRVAELDRTGNPTLAYLASGIEGIKVRLTAKGADEAEASALLAAEEAEVRAILGDLVFGIDDQTIEFAVLALLRERGLTLGVAESLTGGLMASRICDVPGASDVFRGSVVSYAADVKFSVLGVPEGPVVTAEAAAAMAAGARSVLGSDVGIGVTGVAGPGPDADGIAAGTVFVGLDLGPFGGDAGPEAFEVKLPGDRLQVRQFSVITALSALRSRLLALRAAAPSETAFP